MYILKQTNNLYLQPHAPMDSLFLVYFVDAVRVDRIVHRVISVMFTQQMLGRFVVRLVRRHVLEPLIIIRIHPQINLICLLAYIHLFEPLMNRHLICRGFMFFHVLFVFIYV